MPDAAPLEPGDPRSLGQYEVVGRLGAGGQGAVFLGRGPDGANVAIKLLHAQMASDPSARARFTREVSAAQRVEPFCTARVLEADVQGDQPYVVSEYIDGPSLHDVVAHKGPLNATELERLAIGTVTALAAIHEAGIVHRDFKPNNVMLASDGPRVVDFGIARTVNSQESAVTATGMVVGTPGYLAPEQLTGAPLTPAVDIFAWGATMVFAGTGQSPFEADTLPVIIQRILNEEPDLSALPPGPLREVIGRCLSKDAGLRPPAAQLLLNLLGHVGAAPSGSGGSPEDLLNQGTRIAAQMPAPPRVPPAPAPQQNTPPPQSITPPPMPMNQGGFAGPNTPPPQPVTPPPMPMYSQGPPPPPQMPPGPGPQPPYGPPPKSSSSNTGVIIGVGCGVLAIIAVIAVLVVVFVVADNDDDPPTITIPTPNITYTPPTSGSSGDTIPSDIRGVWKGRGQQPNAGSGRTSFESRMYIYSDYVSVYYDYDDTPTCRTKLTLLQESGSTLVFRETPRSGQSSTQCAPGYVTFNRIDSNTIRWAWSTSPGGSAKAFGTISKN